MSRIFKTICFALLLLSQGEIFAQHGLNSSHLHSSSPISQRWQPANILNSEAKFAYGGDVGIWVNNNAFTLQGVLAENGYITEETRQRMVDQAAGGLVLSTGTYISPVNVNVDIKGRKWAFFVDHFSAINAKLDEKETVGLALLGNKPYRGTTVSDANIRASQATFRSIGAGTGFDLGKIQLGVRAKIHQGYKIQRLQNTSYSLFTAQDGTQIDLTADYQYFRSPEISNVGFFNFQGIGAGVDVGMKMELNEKMTLTTAVLDLGLISWGKTRQYENSTNIQFEGITVTSLFADDLSDETQAQVDSLQDLLLPDSTVGSRLTMTNTTLRVGLEYKLSEVDALYPEIIYSPATNGNFTRLPLVNVAYQRELNDWLTVGANAFGGGTRLYGFGLMADADLQFGGKYGLNVNIASDGILGAVLPSVGRGFSVSGGLGFYLLGE